jgi:hypothetical protein
MSAVVCLDDLPDELVYIILVYFTGHYTGLIKFSVVCGKWKRVADRSMLWFSNRLIIRVPKSYMKGQALKVNATSLNEPLAIFENMGKIEVFDKEFKLFYDYSGIQILQNFALQHTPSNALKIRNWFVPFMVEQKRKWKWYSSWIPFLLRIDNFIFTFRSYFNYMLLATITLLGIAIFSFHDVVFFDISITSQEPPLKVDLSYTPFTYWHHLGFLCLLAFQSVWIFQTLTDILYRICLYFFTMKEIVIGGIFQPMFFFGIDRYFFLSNMRFIILLCYMKLYFQWMDISWTMIVGSIAGLQGLQSLTTMMLKFTNTHIKKDIMDRLIVVSLHIFLPFSFFLSFLFTSLYYDYHHSYYLNSHSLPVLDPQPPPSSSSSTFMGHSPSSSSPQLFSAYIPLIPIFVVIIISMTILTVHLISMLTSPYYNELRFFHAIMFVLFSAILCRTVYCISSLAWDCYFPSEELYFQQFHLDSTTTTEFSSIRTLNHQKRLTGSQMYFSNEWNPLQLILIIMNNVQSVYLITVIDENIKKKRYFQGNQPYEGLFS